MRRPRRERRRGQIAVHDRHDVGLAAQQSDDLLVGERQRPDERLLEAGVLERDLQPLVDPFLDGDGQCARQRPERLGQARFEASLDTERVDDLRADPRGDGIRDVRLDDDAGDQVAEPARVERDLVRSRSRRSTRRSGCRRAPARSRRGSASAARCFAGSRSLRVLRASTSRPSLLPTPRSVRPLTLTGRRRA